MLYVHTNNTNSTTEVTIRNRLYYLLILDSISQEETSRLWEEFAGALMNACETSNMGEDIKLLVHYLWWENSMVGAIFITSDILTMMDKIGFDVKAALTELEGQQIKIPYCSVYHDIFIHGLGEQPASGVVPSRIVTTLDDENAAVTVTINNGDPILRCGFAEV